MYMYINDFILKFQSLCLKYCMHLTDLSASKDFHMSMHKLYRDHK